MMTEQEMRVAIAQECEICPHHWEKGRWYEIEPYVEYNQDQKCKCKLCGKESTAWWHDVLPDYPNDLNAMHEAEKVLDEKTGHSSTKCLIRDYWLELMDMLNPDEKLWDNGTFLGSWANAIKVGNATAKQRAEAFCRTLFPERFKE